MKISNLDYVCMEDCVMKSTLFVEHYGKQINDNSKFCAYCGHKFEEKPQNESEMFQHSYYKESYIKEIADKYQDIIPEKLYIAMYNYEIEYND